MSVYIWNKVSSVMGRDDSWPATVPSVVPTGVTVPTDLFITFTRPTGPFLSEWAKCQPRNTQNGLTVLPIANLMAESESGSPVSYSSFLVNMFMSLSFADICVWQTDRRTDGRMDNVDHYYSWPPHCHEPANRSWGTTTVVRLGEIGIEEFNSSLRMEYFSHP